MEYILGVFVSIIIEGIKRLFGTSKLETMIALLTISLVVGGAYIYFVSTPYWETIVAVLASAAAFHNLVIRRIGE